MSATGGRAAAPAAAQARARGAAAAARARRLGWQQARPGEGRALYRVGLYPYLPYPYLGAQHGRQRGLLQHGAPEPQRVEGPRRAVHKRRDAQRLGLGRVRAAAQQLPLPAGRLRRAAQVKPAPPRAPSAGPAPRRAAVRPAFNFVHGWALQVQELQHAAGDRPGARAAVAQPA